MNEMLAESCFLYKVCTRSVLNTGWETEAVAQWNEMSDYRSSVGLTLILLGKFTGKNSIPVFYLFSFQALAVKEGRRREIEQGMNSVRGREKLQYSVTKVGILVTSRTTFTAQVKML